MSSPANANADVAVASPPADAGGAPNGTENKVEGVAQDKGPTEIASSPPVVSGEVTSGDAPAPGDDKDGGKSDSEAETIVLAGKEGEATPSKTKRIKHEDAVNGEVKTPQEASEVVEDRQVGAREEARAEDSVEAQPKSHKAVKEGAGREGGNSSDLSSAPSSPATRTHTSKRENSESDRSRSSPPPHQATEDGQAQASRVPRKRKLDDREAPLEGADRHHDNPRKQTNDTRSERSRDRRDTRSSTTRDTSPGAHSPQQRASRERSRSPRLRAHRKSASYSNLNLSNGISQKRKRAPPPLQTSNEHSIPEGHSDDSSREASPTRRGVLSEHLGEYSSAMSPIKGPHKRTRIDKHGRTALARLCADSRTDKSTQTLEEEIAKRPEDIDIPDYAGNTPVQTASLEGKAKVVKILIDNKCDVNCKNNDKDTPLIDAVENGHLQVVNLLLAAGADPRQGNVNGEEPVDLVDPENAHYEAIRRALEGAKSNTALRRASEDNNANSAVPYPPMRSSRGVSFPSPRQSPPAEASRSPPPTGIPPRRKTVRSEATRNDLLWMKPTTENLRDRAGKGDSAGVAHILNVSSQADSESLIAAAKGGHDDVMQLLLGIGGADPDPDPSSGLKPGGNTPILAAIGRGNENVIRLLLAQPKFNPTRRDDRGLTYPEIAQERQGAHWEKELEILKEAYDKHVLARKGRRDASSSSPDSARKVRDREKEPKRRRPDENRPSQLRGSHSPPARERGAARRDSSARESKNGVSDRTPSSRDPAKPPPSLAQNARSQPKHKDDTSQRRSSTATNRDSPSSISSKSKSVKEPKPRPSDPTVNRASPEGDGSKPRRKLVSGKIYRGDQERVRRTSVVATASEENVKPNFGPKKGPAKLKSELTEPTAGHDDTLSSKASLKTSVSDSEVGENGASCQEKMVKTEESQDRVSLVRGDGNHKRPRNSASPPRSSSQPRHGQTEHAKKKRRRLEGDDGYQDHSSAAGDLASARHGGRDGKAAKSTPPNGLAPHGNTPQARHDQERNTKDHQPQLVDVEVTAPAVHNGLGAMQEVHKNSENPHEGLFEDAGSGIVKEANPEERRDSTDQVKEDQERNEQLLREQAEQAQRDRAAEESRKQADEERLRVEAEDNAEQARRLRMEQEEADRKDRIAREEEEARMAERRKVEEAERQARIAEEEERIRVEKKRREEEQQRRRAEQERIRREEAERRRAEHEERQRLELLQRQEEQERARREALPWAMQRLAELPTDQLQSRDEATNALPFFTTEQKRLEPHCPAEHAEEEWTTNIQVAMVFGEKDLALSRYTAWTRRPMTERHKVLMWRVLKAKLQGSLPPGLDLREQPRRDRFTQSKFRILEPVFWVKLSDIIDIAPRYAHLQTKRLDSCLVHDLSRSDPGFGYNSVRMDEYGWTVTPWRDGRFESYDARLQKQNGDLSEIPSLFRPLSEPPFFDRKLLAKVNGVVNHTNTL